MVSGRTASGKVHFASERRAVTLCLVLVLLLMVMAAGCAGKAREAKPTATPSALARELVGRWKITEGVLAKTDTSVAGETMEFRSDGTYTWEKREGTYSVYEDLALKMVSTYGESLSYEIKLEGDRLEMSHYTDCGKRDHFMLARIK